MEDHLDTGTNAHRHGLGKTNEILRHALAERERFLARYPHLQPYQDEIDRLLDNSGDSQGRMAVLGMLMQGKLIEMQKELLTLVAILK